MTELTTERLVDDGVLAPIHQAFADTIRRLDATSPPSVSLSAAIVSEQLSRGHVCFDLGNAADVVFSKVGSEEPIRYDDWPKGDAWANVLRNSPCVTVCDSEHEALDLERPLVLDQKNQLYLARYWFYQQRLAVNLANRISGETFGMNEGKLASDIEHLFPDRHRPEGSDQCVAATSAVDRRLTIITGGPGTGKTTSVAKILALRLLQHDATAPPLKALLMAPTGKAAQRLNEALGRAAERLDINNTIREQLQQIKAGTIHRILKWSPITPERGGPFRHNAEFPLDVEVAVIDEASMVDLGLMWHLFEALPQQCLVIVMGDRDQLASVEAGGVLADLCGNVTDARSASLTPSRCELIKRRTGVKLEPGESERDDLDGSVVNLRYSHRFDASSSLASLAAKVRDGDAGGAIEALAAKSGDQIEWIKPDDNQQSLDSVVRLAVERYEPYLQILRDDPRGSADVLRQLNRFRVLCAHREGRWGDRNLNQSIIDSLADRGLLAPRSRHYIGQPVMITRNNYQHQVFNGDVGIVVRSKQDEGLAALFEDPSAADGCRRLSAALLPESTSCFAMTIHKSQGSEFHNVMIILPPRESPILTRELLYTGITRVADETDAATGDRRKGKLYIVANEEVLRTAITNRIRRPSGLRKAVESLARVEPADVGL